jgi:rubrerythrin
MGIISVGARHNRFVEGGHMLDERRTTGSPVKETEGEYVEFVRTGAAAVGAYHCSGCGYGVTVHAQLPSCPMCGGTTWEQASWSPFSRIARQMQ